MSEINYKLAAERLAETLAKTIFEVDYYGRCDYICPWYDDEKYEDVCVLCRKESIDVLAGKLISKVLEEVE